MDVWEGECACKTKWVNLTRKDRFLPMASSGLCYWRTMGSALEETILILKLIFDAPEERILQKRKWRRAKLHQNVCLPRNFHWKSVLLTLRLLKFRPGSLQKWVSCTVLWHITTDLATNALVNWTCCEEFWVLFFHVLVPHCVSYLRLSGDSVWSSNLNKVTNLFMRVLQCFISSRSIDVAFPFYKMRDVRFTHSLRRSSMCLPFS